MWQLIRPIGSLEIRLVGGGAAASFREADEAISFLLRRRRSASASPPSTSFVCCRCSNRQLRIHRLERLIVRMTPEEEKMTRCSPVDFPIEWGRPKPWWRADIFPQFSPMKTPLSPPLPADPPEKDEEEEEMKEEEDEDPEKEESEKPEKYGSK